MVNRLCSRLLNPVPSQHVDHQPNPLASQRDSHHVSHPINHLNSPHPSQVDSPVRSPLPSLPANLADSRHSSLYHAHLYNLLTNRLCSLHFNQYIVQLCSHLANPRVSRRPSPLVSQHDNQLLSLAGYLPTSLPVPQLTSPRAHRRILQHNHPINLLASLYPSLPANHRCYHLCNQLGNQYPTQLGSHLSNHQLSRHLTHLVARHRNRPDSHLVNQPHNPAELQLYSLHDNRFHTHLVNRQGSHHRSLRLSHPSNP